MSDPARFTGTQAKMNVMTSLLAVVSANLSVATTSREQLRATSEANKSAAASAAKATSIAIAGVVLSVLLAALAILLAACYAHKTRVIDAKYRQVHSDCCMTLVGADVHVYL